MKKIGITIFLTLALVLTGFGQNDTVQKAKLPAIRMQVGEIHLPAINETDILWENSYAWISYQMKVEMTEDEEKLAFQCFFVNRMDSLMYFNLHKSGVELARVVLTPDSVIFVNKLEKEYYRGDYRFFGMLFGIPLNFNMIQSIMNARDFVECEGTCTRNDEGNETHLIWPQRTCGGLSVMQEMTVAPNGVPLRNELTELSTMREVTIQYGEWDFGPISEAENTDTLGFFNRLAIEINSEDVKIDATLSKVKVNTPGPTSIKIPESFTEMGKPEETGKKEGKSGKK